MIKIKIKGGKIILHSKSNEYRVAFEVSTVHLSQADGHTWVWESGDADGQFEAKESFDEILEAIEQYSRPTQAVYIEGAIDINNQY